MDLQEILKKSQAANEPNADYTIINILHCHYTDMRDMANAFQQQNAQLINMLTNNTNNPSNLNGNNPNPVEVTPEYGEEAYPSDLLGGEIGGDELYEETIGSQEGEEG